MAVTATGALSLPLAHLEDLVTAVTAFQTFVGAADQTEAKASFHLVAVEVPADERPFALAEQEVDGGFDSEVYAGGSRFRFRRSGQLQLTLEKDAVAGLSRSDAELTFTNEIGAIVAGMEQLAGSSGYLNIRNIQKIGGPVRSIDAEETAEGDYFQIRFAILWGRK